MIKTFIAILITVLHLAPLNALCQQSKVLVTKIPSWVKQESFNATASPPEGQESGVYYLLVDEQENTLRQERFYHYSYRILTNEGIQEMSDINVEFDPSYQTLTFHHLRIHRNGKVIDQSTNQIQIIQREESMDRFLYDGSLTAVTHLSDIRVGDIIEYSFTRKGYNPAFEGHYSRKIYFDYGSPYEKLSQRIIVDPSLPLKVEYRNTDTSPETETTNLGKEYTWSFRRMHQVITDNNTPGWYDPYQRVLITDFDSWGDVAGWASNHFRTTQADQKILQDKIKDLIDTPDVETYAISAIRFVQDEIRYLGFESGLNSHKPHAAVKVLDQRFGDCKDKSLLLCEILRLRNIEAHPVLVNTLLRDRIESELPSVYAFDHCVVQMKLGDKIHYIDPTVSNQGGTLEDIHFPEYGKGLVVFDDSEGLVDLPASSQSQISEAQTIYVTSLTGEAVLNIKTTYTGGKADNIRGDFLRNSLASVQKNYLNYYASLYPDLEVYSPLKTDDNRNANIFVVEENYRIPSFWQQNEDASEQMYSEVYQQTLEDYFNITKSPKRTDPYSLAYPVSYNHSIIIKLPEEWNISADEKLIETPYYEYEYRTAYSNNEVSISTNYKTKQDFIPVESFDKFIRDHDEMMGNLGYQLSYNKNIVFNKKGISWMAVVTALVTLGFGIWLALRIYYYYDPEPAAGIMNSSPIGGWLILPAIGLSIAPFRLLVDLLNMPEVYNSQTWENLLGMGRYGLYAFVYIEHVYNTLLLPYAVLIVVLFFKRRSSLPRLITIYYFVTCLVTIADFIVATGLQSAEAQNQKVIQSILTAAIWIPYFNIATRVKETFVNRISGDGDDNNNLVAEMDSGQRDLIAGGKVRD